MIYMNKIFPTLLLLSSCGSISLSEIPVITSAILNDIDSSELSITKDFYNARKYSFIKVFIDGTVSTMTLSAIDQDKYTWINAFDESIVTLNGMIIETNGFTKDMSQIECKNNLINQGYDFCKGKYGQSDNISQTFLLSSPKAMIEINSRIKTQAGQSPTIIHDHDISYIQQTFKTKILDWRGTNEFWYDPIENLPIKTLQYYHPMAKPAEIEFYFIFE